MKTRTEVARLIRASETPEAMAEVVGQSVEEYEREIARLRRIEEAARKFMDEEIGWIGDRPYYIYAGRPAVATTVALRAALKEDR